MNCSATRNYKHLSFFFVFFFSFSYTLALKDYTRFLSRDIVIHCGTLSNQTTAGCHTLTLHSLTLTDSDTAILDTVTHTHIDTYMAYINENMVKDITKVDGYRKNTNLERFPVYIPALCLSHTCTLIHTHIQDLNEQFNTKQNDKQECTDKH